MTATMTWTNEILGNMTRSGLLSMFLGTNCPGLPDRPQEADFGEAALPWMDYITPMGKERSTCQSVNVVLSMWETVFTPRTELGRRLYALRTKALAAGMKLLSEEEVLEEVKRRRGEIEENEKDLY